MWGKNLKYSIQQRKLTGVNGDPSWPYPKYSYVDAGTIDTQSPVQRGDSVNGKRVIEVRHEDGKSIIIIGN